MDEGKEDETRFRVSQKGSHGTRNTIIDGDWLFQPGVSLSNTRDSWTARYRLRRYLSAEYFQRPSYWKRNLIYESSTILPKFHQILPGWLKKRERKLESHTRGVLLERRFSSFTHRKNNRKSSAHKRHSTTRNESRPFASSEQSTPSFTAKHWMHLEDISTGLIHGERANRPWKRVRIAENLVRVSRNWKRRRNKVRDFDEPEAASASERCPTPLSLCRRLAARCPITIYLRVKALASHANGWRALACAAAHEHRRDKFSPRTCTECETMTHRWIIPSFAIWRPSAPPSKEFQFFHGRKNSFGRTCVLSREILVKTLISSLSLFSLSNRFIPSWLRFSSLLSSKMAIIQLKFRIF